MKVTENRNSSVKLFDIFEYDAAGNIVKALFEQTSGDTSIQTLTYDGSNRLTKLEVSRSNNPTKTIARLVYIYTTNKANPDTIKTLTYDSTTPGSEITTLKFD